MSTQQPSQSFQMTPPLISAAFPPSASTSTTSRMSRTPRSHSQVGPSRTPAIAPLPRDHIYPSTAPLPNLPSFLGSPFSTKTARGRYMYQTTSPSQNAAKAIMTEHLPQGGYFEQQGLEWLENNEWSPVAEERDEFDEQTGTSGGLPHPPSRLRRRTNGSSSSMDDLSGSGTSSASLLSLARSSLDQQSRPNIRTIWDEAQPVFHEDEESDPTPPSRQLFGASTAEGALHISAKPPATIASPSPFVSQSAKPTATAAQQQSPYFMHVQSHTPISQPPSKYDGLSISPNKTNRTPFSSFIPRMLSSRKKSSSTKGASPSLQATVDDEILTDTDEPSELGSTRSKKFWGRGSFTTARNPMEGGDFEPSLGVGLGLGMRRSSAGRAIDLARSLSSDSSGDIAASPSRPMSAKTSTSLFVKASPRFSPKESAQQSAPTRPSFPGRKALVQGGSGTNIPVKSSPNIPTIGSLRQNKSRPPLRRGITEPAETQTPPNSGFLSVNTAFNTPTTAFFGDVKPSPAAFASTGLVKKRSGISGAEIPRFGTDSEPVGEAKRAEAAVLHGMSAGLPSPLSPIKPLPGSVLFSGLNIASSNGSSNSDSTSTSNSNNTYIQNAQRTRGLRRKGSTMFTASGSIGSIDMIRGDSRGSSKGCISPATPTKPGLQGLGLSTPSPTGGSFVYPFAPSTAANPLATPPNSNQQYRSGLVEPPSAERYRQMPARVRQISNSHHIDSRGPIARASNPMLAASYKASIHVIPETPSSGAASSCTAKEERLAKNITRLEKDFVIVQSLGSGAFSQVWKVKEKKTGRFYAVKAGKPYTGAKNRLRQLEEISILRQLSLNPHPNIVNYVDSWESHSRLYIRTTMAECGDLARFLGLLGDYGGLGEARVWKTLVELADGIAHIHKHNFLHLDIKPSNILINREGGLVIADLGMAVICDEGPEGRVIEGLSPALPESDERGGFIWNTMENVASHEKSHGATKEVGILTVIPSPILDREVEGDREYLCPEALGDEPVGKGADVFSLGILVLEAALNVVLPSNGEGWVKLRNNDFSDLDEHYMPRRSSSRAREQQDKKEVDPSVPVLSDAILSVIKGMMRSIPGERSSMEDVWNNDVVSRVRRATRSRALVEEDERWLSDVLREGS
nr:uncharacterized protein CI109_000561 [Kwoniella shandongensis]KAA5530989.1 hypothetical protein CI109_000561 [Kwoniella shandongensis]